LAVVELSPLHYQTGVLGTSRSNRHGRRRGGNRNCRLGWQIQTVQR